MDDLLRLVRSDASLVMTIEGLRDQIRSIGSSRLAADFRQLPAVRSWFGSDKYRHLERSAESLEAALGIRLVDLRDEVLGDAVVLVVRLAPDDPPDPSRARGMLLLKARDPGLLERAIAAVNSAQRRGGELDRLMDRRRGETSYHAREFPEASGKPPEWYVTYPDGTFAFSNSEELIRDVIDRKARASGSLASATNPGGQGGGEDHGLGGSRRWMEVRRRLPARPLASLYVDPRSVERLLAASPRTGRPGDLRVRELVERHLASVQYAGASLAWGRDAIVLHEVETLDASRVDGWLRRWAGDRRPVRPDRHCVPRTALALASAHVNAAALRDLFDHLVPEADHPRLRNLEAVLSGLLLGQDLSSRILPALGPGLIAYVDGPGDPVADERPGPGPAPLFPLVLVVEIPAEAAGPVPGARGQGSSVPVADAIQNALRTLLALSALDEKRGAGRSTIVASEAAGVAVTTLSTPVPFAYAIDRAEGRLVLGTSAAAVARYLESRSDPEAGARFRDLPGTPIEGVETFACVDLEALTRLAGRHRDRLARGLAARQKQPAEEVARDLEHVLALSGLFRAAFFATRIEPDASALHRRLGLVPRE